MAQIVPRSLYTNSATWNSTFWQIAAITGPAVGGLIYGFFGVKVAYMTVIALNDHLFLFNIKYSQQAGSSG